MSLRSEHNQVLYQVARDIVRASTLPEVARAALAGVGALLPGHTCDIGTIDSTRGCVTMYDAAPSSSGLGAPRPLATLDLNLRTLRKGTSVRSPDETGVVVPIRDHALLLGALWVRGDVALATSDVALVEEVADLVAAGMRRERLGQDLLRAQDAARRANEQKTSFLNHVSHEIRTPLNAILGYLELIREEGDDLPTVDLYADLDRVHHAARHLLALINDVLDLGKLEAGKLDLTLTTVDLLSLLEDVDAVARPLVAAKHNRWHWTELEEAWVLGDPLRLRQVLLNLIGNAAKFTEHGEISLSIGLTERAVRIDVADTGLGIAEAHLEHLFEPFVQVHEASAGFGGTGLGLAITKQYVEMMGGTISATSQLGQGSTFRVELLRVIPDRGGD